MKMSSNSFTENKEDNFYYKKVFLKICVAAPCLLLFFIIFFVYAVYQTTYIIPLLSETYWYDNNPNSQLTDVQFPIFKEIINYEEQVILNVYRFKARDILNNELEISHFTRGLIFVIIEHYLLVWLLYSLIKTIRTDPGGVPDESSPWALKISAIMENYKAIEIKNFRKLKKNKNQNLNHNPNRNPNPNPNQSIFPSILSTIVAAEEEQKKENDQGRQGTNSEKSSLIFNESDQDSIAIEEEFTANERILISIRTLEQARRKENLRYCQHCHHFKPLRTHHCQQCMKCILKMDHHCQWLLTCVGFRNYKFFLNMLIYANLNIIFIGSTFIRCVMDVALNPYIEGGLLYLIIFCFMLIVVLFVLVFGFTCFHFWLIFTARTSLEYCEKWKKKEGVENNITNFDEGNYKNFANVFNRNPLLWFFPFNPNEEGEGLFEDFENQNLGEL